MVDSVAVSLVRASAANPLGIPLTRAVASAPLAIENSPVGKSMAIIGPDIGFDWEVGFTELGSVSKLVTGFTPLSIRLTRSP